MREPTHLTGPEYLEVVRGHRRAPAPPFTYDTNGLTPSEYDELLLATGRIRRIVADTDGLKLSIDFPDVLP
jgi:hypothetical protein